MNKEQICGVLECCLLISDGVSIQRLTEDYGFNLSIAKAGLQLFNFLKSKEIQGGVFQNEQSQFS
jgi:hypothetical protein